MATSKQEQLYNEIIQYYDFAEKLVQITENSQDEIAEQQFEIIQEAIERFEKCADFLANQYIEYVKTGESSQLVDATRSSLRDISAKLEECRNKILILHNKD
ncbi:MAG: hypothetical protein FJX30_00065 [Alphaproteobacteria bacterium]|nr:hypothetical protein [Alphaproteobacteria bacterium]